MTFKQPRVLCLLLLLRSLGLANRYLSLVHCHRVAAPQPSGAPVVRLRLFAAILSDELTARIDKYIAWLVLLELMAHLLVIIRDSPQRFLLQKALLPQLDIVRHPLSMRRRAYSVVLRRKDQVEHLLPVQQYLLGALVHSILLLACA